MPTVQHNTLTSAELHEPKGVAAATANETYVANGAASGSWTEPEPKGVSGAALGDVYVADGAASGTWQQQFQYTSLFTDEADAAAVSTIGTTVQTWPFTTLGVENGITGSTASNNATIVTTGIYSIQFNASVAPLAAGDAGDYEWKLNVNASPTDFGMKRTISGAADTGSGSFSCLIALTAAQVVTISIESDEVGDTDDLIIYTTNLVIHRVG